jgi:hypothetical protein
MRDEICMTPNRDKRETQRLSSARLLQLPLGVRGKEYIPLLPEKKNGLAGSLLINRVGATSGAEQAARQRFNYALEWP